MMLPPPCFTVHTSIESLFFTFYVLLAKQLSFSPQSIWRVKLKCQNFRVDGSYFLVDVKFESLALKSSFYFFYLSGSWVVV